MLRVRTCNQSGFTLVEVLVSLACMAICFVAIWALHFSAIRIDARNQYETDAISLANSELDRLRTVAQQDGFEDLINEGDSTVTNRAFTIVRTIVRDAVQQWRATVTVTVTWRERTGGFGDSTTTAQRRVQMATVITDLS